MKNYSKQREAILTVLRQTDTHPTANWIYEQVREIIPNISLGTVYRNLSELSLNGDILSLHVGDGFEHFDYDTSPHAHLHCKACGCIADAKLESDPSMISTISPTLTEISIFASGAFPPSTPIFLASSSVIQIGLPLGPTKL